MIANLPEFDWGSLEKLLARRRRISPRRAETYLTPAGLAKKGGERVAFGKSEWSSVVHDPVIGQPPLEFATESLGFDFKAK